MHRFQIKIRTIFLELLLVYPVINIMGCVFFHGDNMTTLSLSYCSILILLYVTDVKKLSRKNIYILIIFAFILILEIYRDQNMFILFVTFIFANIMLSIYSSNKIMVKEYIEYFVKKKNQFYIVQLVFLIILFLFVMKNGLTAGWNTWVLQGPYNYPHTLAYLFLFMMMLDTFYFIEFREKFVILFIAVSFACIILTAVRSVLIPLIATVVGWWVNSCADKYIVTFILGISANGLLSVSYKIPQIINTIQGIFTQAWQISAIKEYGSSDTADFYGKTFIVINLMMCIVCSFLIFMTRPLAYILYANDFYEAWKYVPFLLVSSVLNCASGLLGPILSAKKNSKAMMWSAIVGAVANIIMNIVFVNLTGIQGATFATLVSSYIIYIIRKYAVGEDIYINNYYVIIVTWLILVVQGIIESNFMNYYLEILCVVVIIIINKNSVWQVLNLVKNIYKNIK